MGEGTLTIYSASAGSGKTYQLAGLYLEKLFRSRLNYRKILAVTFTHKATAEMKNRILDELYKLSTGISSDYLSNLIASTGKDENQIRAEAGEILFSMLHDFTRFSVSTIDSFYQKIIRAFARDIGLHSGFSIDIDHTKVLSLAIDEVIDSAGSDRIISNWLSLFVRSNIDEGRSWDLKKSITALSAELFNEKFKLLSAEEKEILRDKEFLVSYISEINSLRSKFQKELKDLGQKCTSFFNEYSLSDDMFYQKGRGVPGFIRAISEGIVRQPNAYVRLAVENNPKWSSGKSHPDLEAAIRDGLEKTVREAVVCYDGNIQFYNTAGHVLSNIFILGILSDILDHVHKITKDENTFLLSDAGELIYLITAQDQAPFIYERTGNMFENFMIDEFQDTSIIQWKNFTHLISNSLSQGFDNLLVGDVKQSIYRWRNSDWQTLNNIRRSADNRRVISLPLNTNYRSCSEIIKFNNALFSVIPNLLDEELKEHKPEFTLSELYSEAVQNDPGRKAGGFVRMEFIENTETGLWQEAVLKKIPPIIESLQDQGYSASHIGILVRDNIEGAQILKSIIEYGNNCPADKRERYNYNIVSGESLMLNNSPVINFLIAYLRVLDNPDDMISRAVMLRFYLLMKGQGNAEKTPLVEKDLIELSSQIFPEGYNEMLIKISFRPLWNITESAIKFFGLGEIKGNVAYLNTFQDLVIKHSSSRNPGISAFLEWWDTEGYRKSILLPEQQDSIKVLTIHKSKGLEFKAVILPFISWNLDHKSYHTNILWVNPGVSPFNKLPVIPVRYKSDLENSIFAGDYYKEKYSAYLDNLNLLYVAFTRAVNVLIGFAPANAGTSQGIASVLKDAIAYRSGLNKSPDNFLPDHFDESTGIFESGSVPESGSGTDMAETLIVEKYMVGDTPGSLRLKLHWEDYFTSSEDTVRQKINYGKIMHGIFSEIVTIDDVGTSVRKKVVEGILPEQMEIEVSERIKKQLSEPQVREWFGNNIEVYNETSFLMPDSGIKRPDRIIFRNGKATIIDFKFGAESESHKRQVRQYRNILENMGYEIEETCLWYVDEGKIISV